MTSSGVSSQTKGLFRKVSLILNISSIKGWIPILKLRECFHYRQTRYRSWTDWGSSLPSIRNNGPTHFHNWDLIECCLTGASWPGLGELSNSRLASRYQLVNLNNRGKFGKWKDIALCVADMFTIMTRMKYSLGLEPTKDVLGFWSDNSSNRTHWKAQIRREIKLWRPRQSSLIGSGNSCTTEPVGWVFWAGAYSRWPARGAGDSSGPSSHPPEVKKFKSLIFIILDHNQMTFIT